MSLRGANQVLNSTWERRGNPDNIEGTVIIS